MSRSREPLLTPNHHRQYGQYLYDLEEQIEASGKHYDRPNYRSAIEVNRTHKQDFIGQVIPQLLADVTKREGKTRQLAIMDLGCGLGFFTDQLRQAFPQKVKVYGTGFARADAVDQRREFIMAESQRVKQVLAKQGKSVANRLANFSAEMHPNDGKWRTILALSDYPEFDLMIDTFGELYHAASDLGDNAQEEVFRRLIDACCRKLMPGGTLYIGHLPYKKQAYLIAQAQQLQAQYGISMTLTPSHNAPKNLSESAVIKDSSLILKRSTSHPQN